MFIDKGMYNTSQISLINLEIGLWYLRILQYKNIGIMSLTVLWMFMTNVGCMTQINDMLSFGDMDMPGLHSITFSWLWYVWGLNEMAGICR